MNKYIDVSATLCKSRRVIARDAAIKIVNIKLVATWRAHYKAQQASSAAHAANKKNVNVEEIIKTAAQIIK